MKVEKLFSNHKCDKCKKENAKQGVYYGVTYKLVCDKCLEILKYQDKIDNLFHY